MCGNKLPADAPAGLCPRCLLQQGFEDGIGEQSSRAATFVSTKFIPPEPEELAKHFPQLEILELIGKGGMGAVYKARQKQLDRIVALKILPPGIGDDPSFAERFAREAKALAKLNHPGIVTLFEFGSSGRESASSDFGAEKEKRGKGEEAPKAAVVELPSAPFPLFPSSPDKTQPAPGNPRRLYYYLMDFVDGVNLRQLLLHGRISAHEALAIVPQICDALQFAHDQGIVHRDIKPENSLMDRRGRV
jgi:serine/threonine protein kinase